MKIFIALLIALPLAAQMSDTSRVKWQVSSPNTTLCVIDNKGSIRITPGMEKQCWERVVATHNESMNDAERHAVMDKALLVFAQALGKVVVPCAKSTTEPLPGK